MDGRGASQRSQLKRWLRLAALVVVLALISWGLAHNWSAFVDALRQLAPWSVAAALPVGVGAMVAGMFTWRSLMADFGARLSIRDSAHVYYLSLLGKYVPGSVWAMLSQAELARDLRVPRRTSLTVGVLTIVIAEAVGLSLALVTLPFVAPDAVHRYWWVVLIAPLFLAGLHPRLLARGVNLALRVLRRPGLEHAPSWRGLFRTAGWQLTVWSVLGLQAWLLVVGIGGAPGPALLACLGGYALAYSLGLLAIGLPAGAGVRDLALAASLSSVVPPASAVVVALISRLVMTAADLLLAGTQLVRSRRRTTEVSTVDGERTRSAPPLAPAPVAAAAGTVPPPPGSPDRRRPSRAAVSGRRRP